MQFLKREAVRKDLNVIDASTASGASRL